MFSVSFRPDGTSIDVKAGTTVLDAARKASVPIDTMCGGEGTCGKCRIRIVEGEPQREATEYLSRADVEKGYVLGCQSRVVGDLVVEVPSESRVRSETIEFRAVGASQRRASRLDPVIRKRYVEVAPPSLDNNRADMERLGQALKMAGEESAEFEANLDTLRSLPSVMRAAGHKVTATLAWRREGFKEIAEVVGGDRSDRNYAVAVDVGTTTIVANLMDLKSGGVMGTAGKYNSQAAYGPDVIRRILWATDEAEGLAQLHACVSGDINSLIRELCAKLKVATGEIGAVVAAGNTTMTHTFLKINPEWLRREPYVGVSYHPRPVLAREVGIDIAAGGCFYSLPCVSAFVGGDITAGVLATGMADAEAPRMLIDMGTNGEVVIGSRDWMVCASASAGPAFEGAGTRHGMRATAGAIDHFTAWPGGDASFEYTIIGGMPPAGLCGTAYIDLLVQLLRAGAVDKTGRFNEAGAGKRLRAGPDSILEFVVVPAGEQDAPNDLVVTQADIDNLLRAKGAIYATVKVLLKSMGITAADLEEIAVAGAFGTHLDVRNAITIGLLPDEDLAKLKFVGNTSLRGAEISALDVEAYTRTSKLADAMTYYELSADQSFMGEFTSACFLPHTNIEEFPSVREFLKGGANK